MDTGLEEKNVLGILLFGMEWRGRGMGHTQVTKAGVVGWWLAGDDLSAWHQIHPGIS